MSSRSCPECGSPASSDQAACLRCGAIIDRDAPAEQQDTADGMASPLPSRRAHREKRPRSTGSRLPREPVPRRVTILSIVIAVLALVIAAIWGGTTFLARTVDTAPASPAPMSPAPPGQTRSVPPESLSASPSAAPTLAPTSTPVAGPITLNPAAGPVDLVDAAGDLWCRFAVGDVRCAVENVEYSPAAAPCAAGSLPAAASITDAGVAFPCVPAVEFPFSSPLFERDIAYVLGDVQCLLSDGAGVTCFRADGTGFQLGADNPPITLP